ncbi:MAG: WD40 repeat domain-containing protein, partial [Bacteroidetes bacterium]|nr:WD40 repeat domain-containing protein [Bacteroidota bacterium]
MNKYKKEKTFIINKLEDNPMKQLIIFITLIMLLTVAKTKSAEIIPVWNRTIEGKVQDMEFLKGQNEVLMLVGEGAGGQIQRRNPENGELIHTYSQFMSSFTKLALTPDSLMFVQINGIDGSLRVIDDNYSITSTFSLSENQEDSLIVYFTTIVIDPSRPNAYVTTYGWNKNTNQYAPRGKVIAYNYETGEHIKDLTEYGEDEYTAIEVSHDGKYLATLNDNKAYLKVWDLESMELIINEPLFDENSDDWCEAQDIYFSKINPDLIYYSGLFTKKVHPKDIYPPSIYTFKIQSKTKELLLPNEIYGGFDMIFFDFESKILSSGGLAVSVLDLKTKKLEFYGVPPENVYSNNIVYNEREKYFLG